MARFEFYKDATAVWRWRWSAPDGSTIMQSEAWKAGAYAAAAPKNRRLVQGAIAPEAGPYVPPPPDKLVRVIGTDFGDGPVPNLAWFEKARLSYEGCWVPTGSWEPDDGSFWWRTIDVLNLYEAAGFKYFLTYHRPNDHVLEAWNALGGWKHKIHAFCFDVEDVDFPLTPGDVSVVQTAMMDDGVDPFKRLWLYSSKYMWEDVQGTGDARFANMFEHIAPYDGVKVGWPSVIPSVNLWGGFTQSQVDGLQLRGAEDWNYQYLDGIAMHESVFNRDALEG